jgi:signal transduction histidine kinase
VDPLPIRLLLVEDNPADALLLAHTLADAGEAAFQMVHVQSMTEALHRLARDSFDAVLLDLSLPDSYGVDTVAQTNAAAPNLPIVVMTGLDDEATAVEAVRKGAQDYLVKGHSDGRFLAASIRYALERKQAEQQLKALNETLEHRVAERTATATRRAAQLQALAVELTQTEHRERRRLAQILHDHLQQLLYAARLHLQTLRGCGPNHRQPQEIIDRVDALLGECIAEARTLTVQICPPVLHEAGLAAALEWLGRDMEQTCGLVVDVHADSQAEPESEEVRILLFEAARELLFNVVKHAEAGRAAISMSVSGNGEVSLVVSDGGRGFKPADAKCEGSQDAGFGLFSIRERLELLGGRIDVQSAPKRGTRVSISVSRRKVDDVRLPQRISASAAQRQPKSISVAAPGGSI